MDFMIELIHEVKCSLKYIIYYYIVLIESLATNLHSFKLLIIFIKSTKIDTMNINVSVQHYRSSPILI